MVNLIVAGLKVLALRTDLRRIYIRSIISIVELEKFQFFKFSRCNSIKFKKNISLSVETLTIVLSKT